MMGVMGSAPVTRNKRGSVRCVECGVPFSAEPDRATVLVEGTEQGWSGVDSAGQFRRSLTPTPVSRRWHADCLEQFEASNADLREQVRLERREVIEAMAVEAGVDVRAALARFDEKNPPTLP